MKRLILTVSFALAAVGSAAQSNDFMQVYDACVYARISMSDGQGSNAEVARAGELLNSVKWNYLNLFNEDVKGETEFEKKTMVFTPEYLKQFSEDKRLVYNKAREYAEEKASLMRNNGNVKMCTKCIAGNSSVTYKLRQYGNVLDVAVVAEVDGLVNQYVVIEDENGKKSGRHKDTTDEFKGAGSRRIHIDNVPSGNNTAYITIENKYAKTRSVAIIIE